MTDATPNLTKRDPIWDGVTYTLRQDFHYQNWIVAVRVDGETTYTRETNDYGLAVTMFRDLVKYGA